jgi:hypothetical protein
MMLTKNFSKRQNTQLFTSLRYSNSIPSMLLISGGTLSVKARLPQPTFHFPFAQSRFSVCRIVPRLA